LLPSYIHGSVQSMNYTAAIVGCVCLLATSCATIKQNVDARALLSKCQYEYAGMAVTGVKFGEGITIDSVAFDVKVKITNTLDKDIAVDHVDLSFYLDGNQILDLGHKRFARIAPLGSSTEPVSVELPFSGITKSLGHKPERIGVKAKIWVTLLVGKETWETPVVIPVEVELPIPYDQINAFVDQQRKKLEQEAKARLEAKIKAEADDALDKAKKLAPPVKVPGF
jgi:hypothetical protein